MNRIKFTNFIFMRMFPVALCVYLFLIAADIISFRIIADKVHGNTVPFEGVIPYTSFDIIFAVSFILCLCIVPLVFFSFFCKSKSVYTLVQIQPGKNSIYNSFFISGFIVLSGLWLSQIVSIFICYDMFVNKSGLLLSVVRTEFFRYFFPFSVSDCLYLAFILVSSVIAAIFGILIISRRNFLGFFTAALWGMGIVFCFGNFKRGFIPDGIVPRVCIQLILVLATISMFRKGRFALSDIEEL